MSDSAEKDFPVHRLRTHRRTITETDIVNFVNLTGLHEPYFIDMEFLKENMSGAMRERFVPGPMIVSFGMGLVATRMMDLIDQVFEGRSVGKFAGMTGVKVALQRPTFPGDTLFVDVEAQIQRITSKGMFVLDLRHLVKNQREEQVADFVETVLFNGS